jgi:hypothetical protein
MEMATTATGAPEQRESREQDKAGKSQIVVVDLDEPQSPVAVKRRSSVASISPNSMR